MKQSKRQYFDFLVLIFLLIVGLVGFLGFAHQPVMQVGIIGMAGVGYVLWGIWHHMRFGNFYWQVILEYALVAGLVFVLTASLLL